MAKLPTPKTSGFNAGKNYFAKMMPLDDIVIDPEISKIFDIQDQILFSIIESIKTNGFDESQPVVLWKGTNILIDGRTRYTASKNVGLQEIPVSEKDFESREDAMLYSFERQSKRRNLTSSEILKAAQVILDRHTRNKHGEGRQGDNLAKRLGIHPTTVYQAFDVLKNSPEETKQQVIKGEKSIKRAYKENRAEKRDENEKVDSSLNSSKNDYNEDTIMELSNSVQNAHANISHVSSLIENHEALELLNESLRFLENVEKGLKRFSSSWLANCPEAAR